TARWNKSAYQDAFSQVQEYIKAGDCYQINLTQEFLAQAKGAVLATAEKFWQLTNA
ncbi:MAG TPA: aminodeoxychorismate synthase component I, partial [Acinetobacter schindleri]|nr:aminodeoxychorismate synthase component I [Acinetobacter schindleri]